MPSKSNYDENGWRLNRIKQLWSELRTIKAQTPDYSALVARIRDEAEAYNRGMSAERAGQHIEQRTAGGHG